jgi:hypothetical protein
MSISNNVSIMAAMAIIIINSSIMAAYQSIMASSMASIMAWRMAK